MKQLSHERMHRSVPSHAKCAADVTVFGILAVLIWGMVSGAAGSLQAQSDSTVSNGPPAGPPVNPSAKWATTIAHLTAEDSAHPPPPNGIVFVGSSSIVKWTSLTADFPGLPVMNRGFGGSELADSVFYADRIVIPYRPRIVVLYAGDNDIAARKNPERVAADFAAFRAKIHAQLPQTRIIYISIKPSPSRWQLRQQMEAANALIREQCNQDRLCTFLDVWRLMLDDQGQPRPELFVKDQLHMNPTGYEIWRRALYPLLDPKHAPHTQTSTESK